MITKRDIIKYYSRQDIQDMLVKSGESREVAGVYRSGNFSQRPGVIIYPRDILAMVKAGVIEFHSSLERWEQPMSLKQDNYESLRKGWDMVIDVDCKLFEHGKITSEVFLWALKRHGLKNVSLKFTGGTGFHIGIPWESIPKEIDYRPTVKQYPSVARTIIGYLKDYSKERLEDAMLRKYPLEDLAHQVGKSVGKIKDGEALDPYKIVEIDTVLVSPRHLFRMPYSLNRKTFLVSLPLRPKDLGDFKKEEARPEKIKVGEGFLDRGEAGESDLLFSEAVDWKSRFREGKEKKKPSVIRETGRITEEFFPPCIKNISKGLPDGRKRSLFILINFLRTLNWKWDQIRKYVEDWNSKNKPPLMENYINSQIRWHSSRKEAVPPPNCESPGRYIDIGICTPDATCGHEKRSIKNPVNYAKKLYLRQKPEKPQKKRKRKKKNPFEYPTAKPS